MHAIPGRWGLTEGGRWSPWQLGRWAIWLVLEMVPWRLITGELFLQRAWWGRNARKQQKLLFICGASSTKRESEGLGEEVTHSRSGMKEGPGTELECSEGACPAVPRITFRASFKQRFVGGRLRPRRNSSGRGLVERVGQDPQWGLSSGGWKLWVAVTFSLHLMLCRRYTEMASALTPSSWRPLWVEPRWHSPGRVHEAALP